MKKSYWCCFRLNYNRQEKKLVKFSFINYFKKVTPFFSLLQIISILYLLAMLQNTIFNRWCLWNYFMLFQYWKERRYWVQERLYNYTCVFNLILNDDHSSKLWNIFIIRCSWKYRGVFFLSVSRVFCYNIISRWPFGFLEYIELFGL